MVTGYALYFRIIVAGLTVALSLTVLSYTLISWNIPAFDLMLQPEYAHTLAFPVALAFWLCAKIVVLVLEKYSPARKYKLDLANLNELSQIVYKKVYRNEMIMVTMENRKVYTGWPVEALNNEDNRWLRLVPQWSGYRDGKFMINITTDYSTVYGDTPPSEQDHTLLSVERIVTIQPFDPDIYEEFNPETPQAT